MKSSLDVVSRGQLTPAIQMNYSSGLTSADLTLKKNFRIFLHEGFLKFLSISPHKHTDSECVQCGCKQQRKACLLSQSSYQFWLGKKMPFLVPRASLLWYQHPHLLKELKD